MAECLMCLFAMMFCCAQHDKDSNVIASERRERGNQQVKNPKQAFKDG
ncbi:MAG: hypothetical protein K2N54_03795 [Helicobacter sp.]|nr:hypothetical protein [Helicobacter sp.]